MLEYFKTTWSHSAETCTCQSIWAVRDEMWLQLFLFDWRFISWSIFFCCGVCLHPFLFYTSLKYMFQCEVRITFSHTTSLKVTHSSLSGQLKPLLAFNLPLFDSFYGSFDQLSVMEPNVRRHTNERLTQTILRINSKIFEWQETCLNVETHTYEKKKEKQYFFDKLSI